MNNQSAPDLTANQVDQVYRSIGEFIVVFSQVEELIKSLARTLLGLSETQYYGLVPAIDFRAACNICKTQLKMRAVEAREREAAVKLINRAQELAEHRNRIAHGFWFVTPEEVVAWHASKTSMTLNSYFEKRGEIDALSRELHDLGDDFTMLADKCDSEPSWRNSPSIPR
jgi:hypothetical protein